MAGKACTTAALELTRTPRVLDDPEVLAVLGAVPHHQDAVVQSGAALAIKDAALVQLELALVSLNGHADGLACHRLHHSM